MRLFKVILLTLGVILISGCVQETPAPIRLGTNVWLGYEPLYLARELEFWGTKEIRLIEYPSASEVLRAFRNKSLEAASLTLDEVLLLRQLDIPVKVILVHDISAGADVIVAKPDIKSMLDVVGKRVGLESNALGAYVISRALEQHNLSLSDIEIKNIDVNAHEDAFLEGEIDAVVTFEPTRTKLLSSGAREIFTSEEIPNEIVDVLVVHQQFIDENPEAIKKLIDGWFKALDYMEANKMEAANMMAKRLRISPQEIITGFDGLIFPNRASNKRLLSGETPELNNTLKLLNRIMVEKELLKTTANVDNILTVDFLR